MAIRWIELDKPLKKQVDKNAQDPTLFFRVMYYVANFELLQQEITRCPAPNAVDSSIALS